MSWDLNISLSINPRIVGPLAIVLFATVLYLLDATVYDAVRGSRESMG